jgi:uncharacterized protein YndB with AHSA1/START domain
MTDDNASQDAVVIERDFDAPAELIWAMWTEPEHFAAWYGPDGASVPVATMDVRVGGTRLVGMQVHTPDGPRRIWFTGEYREVVQNQRLVFTESLCDENGTVLSPAALGMPKGTPQRPRSRSISPTSVAAPRWSLPTPAFPPIPQALPAG